MQPSLSARAVALMVCALVCASLPGQSLGNYYVNGKTGQDVPAAGRTASAPWKTIAYAHTQIPAVNPQTQSNRWYTLFVEGDQVYSPATNGEPLPIVPKYNVWLEGTFVGHGNMPVIDPGMGGTGMRFDRAIRYERNPQTVRYFVFRGGRFGIVMGDSPNQRHRPRVQDCVFRGVQSGISVTDSGSGRGTDPRFFQCTFDSCGDGVLIRSSKSGGVVFPDVAECFFRDCARAGVTVTSEGFFLSANVAGLLCHSCRFSGGQTGILVNSASVNGRADIRVQNCTFRGLREHGVAHNEAVGIGSTLFVEGCSFFECGESGVQSSLAGSVDYHQTLRNNHASRCSAGFSCEHRSLFGDCGVSWRANVAVGCTTGFDLLLSGINRMNVDARGDAAIGNRTGLRMNFSGSAQSRIDIANGRYCANQWAGIDTISNGLGTQFTHLTIADNQTGVLSARPAHRYSHCVFGGNRVDANGTLIATYCCFDRSTVPGVGNLNRTDPKLDGELYKLELDSPCIDAGDATAGFTGTDYEGDPRASVGKRNGRVLPDLGADEYVFGGSVHTYGVGGFGEFGFQPKIDSPHTGIKIGQRFTVELKDAIYPFFGVPATSAMLLLGSRDDHGTRPLELSFYGAEGSLLLNNVIAVQGPFPVTRAGTATTQIPVPNIQRLVGMTFTAQWLAQLRTATPGGFATSNGLRVTLGQ